MDRIKISDPAGVIPAFEMASAGSRRGGGVHRLREGDPGGIPPQDSGPAGDGRGTGSGLLYGEP